MTGERHAPPGDDRLAAGLRGFGPPGLLAIVVVTAGNLLLAPLSALPALLWTWRSATPGRGEVGRTGTEVER